MISNPFNEVLVCAALLGSITLFDNQAFPWRTGLMGDKRLPELVSFLRD